MSSPSPPSKKGFIAVELETCRTSLLHVNFEFIRSVYSFHSNFIVAFARSQVDVSSLNPLNVSDVVSGIEINDHGVNCRRFRHSKVIVPGSRRDINIPSGSG